MSVTFTSTLVETLEAFIYLNSDHQPTPGPQPYNNSPDNSSAQQYSYVTGNAEDGIQVNFTNSYVSVQGTDTQGNIYYWVSFLIDPPSNANNQVTKITEPNTVVDLDSKQYYLLTACDNITPCPNGLGCFSDPITKKSYCTGIGYGNGSSEMWIYIIILILILVLLAVAIFLAFKFFHIVNVRN